MKTENFRWLFLTLAMAVCSFPLHSQPDSQKIQNDIAIQIEKLRAEILTLEQEAQRLFADAQQSLVEEQRARTRARLDAMPAARRQQILEQMLEEDARARENRRVVADPVEDVNEAMDPRAARRYRAHVSGSVTR